MQAELPLDAQLAGRYTLGHCRCESVSLYPAINRCHLTVQSARGPSGAAGWLPEQVITERGSSQSHQRSMTKAVEGESEKK